MKFFDTLLLSICEHGFIVLCINIFEIPEIIFDDSALKMESIFRHFRRVFLSVNVIFLHYTNLYKYKLKREHLFYININIM